MVDAADFVDDENWHGGYYELAIDLGARSDADADGRLVAALDAVWSDPALDGCYHDRRRSRSGQTAMSPHEASVDEPPPLYGVATLPIGATVVCATHVVREIGDEHRAPHDWLDLCLPTGALLRVDSRVGGYPFGSEDSLPWRAPIDEWLVRVAEEVFRVAPFRAALIGFEVSGDPAADNLDHQPIPDDRWIGFVLPHDGGLRFFPANR